MLQTAIICLPFDGYPCNSSCMFVYIVGYMGVVVVNAYLKFNRIILTKVTQNGSKTIRLSDENWYNMNDNF